MNVAPIVAAFRYRYQVLDTYGAETRGLARPAPTIQEGLRQVAADLREKDDPEAMLVRLATESFVETRNAMRDIIARAENDIAIAIGKLATSLGNPPAGPHIALRASLDGIDRSYKAREPAAGDVDAWRAHLDAQLAHRHVLAEIAGALDEARGESEPPAAPLVLRDTGAGRLKLFLFAMIGAAFVAFAIAVFTSMNASRLEVAENGPGPEQPRVVRTVPIVIEPPAATEPAHPCRRLDLDVVAEGAILRDAVSDGRAVVRLEPGEKVVLVAVLDTPAGRAVEVDVPARGAHGFLAEREVRLPVMQWSCDR